MMAFVVRLLVVFYCPSVSCIYCVFSRYRAPGLCLVQQQYVLLAHKAKALSMAAIGEAQWAKPASPAFSTKLYEIAWPVNNLR